MTKLRLAALAIVALLPACAAYTPQGIRSAGTRTEFKSNANAAATARCLAHNAEEYRTTLGIAFNTTVRQTGTGTVELIVTPDNNYGTAAVGDIVPTAEGSAVTLWTNPQRYDLLAKVMRDGC